MSATTCSNGIFYTQHKNPHRHSCKGMKMKATEMCTPSTTSINTQAVCRDVVESVGRAKNWKQVWSPYHNGLSTSLPLCGVARGPSSGCFRYDEWFKRYTQGHPNIFGLYFKQQQQQEQEQEILNDGCSGRLISETATANRFIYILRSIYMPFYRLLPVLSRLLFS